jgi:hypothetical protein
MSQEDREKNLQRARKEIVVEHVEHLKDNVDIKRVELPVELAHQIGECLRDMLGSNENNLLALLCPPGQDGDTRFIDTAIEVAPEDANGDYLYFIDSEKTRLGLKDREMIGFASIYPVRDRMEEAFSVGHKVWISLGDKILESVLDLDLTDPTSATVWAKSGDEIQEIQAIGVE